MPKPAKWAPLYLERLKASRGPRRPGEIFAMKWRGLGYLFGRVVRDRCAMSPGPDVPIEGPWAPSPGVVLLYIYGVRSESPTPPPLRPADLLLPPIFSFLSPWTAGYFLPVAAEPLRPRDVLRRHCFARLGINLEPIDYRDELGVRLARKLKHCSTNAIHNHGSIEVAMSAALGIRHPGFD